MRLSKLSIVLHFISEHQDVDGAVGAGRLHRHDEAAARGPPAGQGEAVSLFVYFYEFVYFLLLCFQLGARLHFRVHGAALGGEARQL